MFHSFTFSPSVFTSSRTLSCPLSLSLSRTHTHTHTHTNTQIYTYIYARKQKHLTSSLFKQPPFLSSPLQPSSHPFCPYYPFILTTPHTKHLSITRGHTSPFPLFSTHTNIHIHIHIHTVTLHPPFTQPTRNTCIVSQVVTARKDVISNHWVDMQ